MIKHTLNKATTDELFADNAVMMNCEDVIYDYKIAELFGADICAWAVDRMKSNHCLEWNKDWSSWGDFQCYYFRRSGFDKIVSYHNYTISVKEYRESKGGQIWDSLWQACQKKV